MMKSMIKAFLCGAVMALLAAIVAPAQATVDQGMALEKQGKYSQAQKVYEEAIAKNPQDAAAHYRIGMIHIQHSQKAELALPWLEKAVALEGNNAEYHFRLGQAYGTLARYASLIKQPGLVRSAREHLELALRYNPRDLEHHLAMIQFYMEAPAILGGSYSKAHQQADELMKLNAPEGHLAHGNVYASQGDKSKAIESYLKALAGKPGDSRITSNLGILYLHTGNYDEAIVHLKNFTDKVPGSGEGFYYLGDAYFKKGMNPEAANAFAQAIRKAPDYAPSYFDMAQCQERMGRKQEALNYYRQFVDKFPNVPRAPAARKKISELGG